MKIKLLGVPLDLGANRRGVDMGPSAIRSAGLSERLQNIGHEVIDMGDLTVIAPEVQTIEDPKLKYLPEITKTATQLANSVTELLSENDFPLVLGGDHSIAIGTVAGVAAFLKPQNKRVGVIWIDAHGDMNTPETTPSGNIHGMPFAVCLGKGVRELTQVAGNFQKVRPQDAVLVGARNLDAQEQRLIRESGITVFTMEDIDRRGIFEVMAEALEITNLHTEALHVSLDMDALDPQEAPGVGTAVRGGLTYREAHTAMEMIAASKQLGLLEVVEVNPILDIRNTTAEVAAELVESALGKRII
ncbi:arginase [candidate division KSB1 bacterium]|nr:arginase [candidate division KSB1 bacterium]NIR70173.1 arginase [candidate division KSB1 bacterium]NIS27559.1 arginase [candidate division KSB1 bacterium]NIT74412.1 arginase [candidate division KSB1 bacterium]NIU28277.1 arginase [candidate division KSB1 bacterium]